MAQMHEVLALPSPRETRTTPPLVNSENLMEYLTWGVIPGMFVKNIPLLNYAPNLDLSMYTPFMEELYKNQKFAPDPDSPEQDKVLEAGRIVYRPSLTTQEVRATEITYGTFESATLDRRDVQEGLNLLDIHTHPENVPFSHIDYVGIMSWVAWRKETHGTLVLCPDIQILALATLNTLTFTRDEASAYVVELRSELSEEIAPVIEELKTQLIKGEKFLEENFPEESAILRSLEDRVEKREITYEQAELSAAEIKKMLMENEEVSQIRSRRDKLKNILANMDNAFRLRLAREIGVKLYYSTNMRDFKEFTA